MSENSDMRVFGVFFAFILLVSACFMPQKVVGSVCCGQVVQEVQSESPCHHSSQNDKKSKEQKDHHATCLSTCCHFTLIYSPAGLHISMVPRSLTFEFFWKNQKTKDSPTSIFRPPILS